MSTKINHSEREHSPWGASSSHRWMNCPASIKRSEGIETKSSEFADEGTVAHELAEIVLRGKEVPKDLLLSQEDNGQDMIENVQVYVDYIDTILADHPEAECYVEQKFCLDYIDKDLYGTNDCVIVDPFNKVWVIDFKYGKGISVSPENNSQLLFYALGALQENDVSKVELVIVQPRLEPQVKTWEVPVGRMEEFEKELKAAVGLTRGNNPPAKAGDHCRFCPASKTCITLRNEAYAVAQVEFKEDEEIILPTPSELTPEQIAQVLSGASLLSHWVSQVSTYANDMAQKGTKIPGYKLVAKRSNRKWIDEEEVIKEFEPVFSEDLFEPRKLKTPAKLEKIVGKDNIDKLTQNPFTGTVLVLKTDKRPEILPKIEQDFKS